MNLHAQGHAFTRQAIPMTWDFGEVNPFSGSGGNFLGNLEYVAKAFQRIPASVPGAVYQLDAAAAPFTADRTLTATDPPYYDNIGYADLSDFFYVWLRQSLATVYPDLFSTLLTPKGPELVATPYRFGGDRKKADQHFERGLALAFGRIREHQAVDVGLIMGTNSVQRSLRLNASDFLRLRLHVVSA